MPTAPYPRTLPALYDRCVVRGGPGEAVRGDGRSLTFREVDTLADRLAAGLLAGGVAPGDRVAVLLENRPEVPVVDVAIARAGGVKVPVNPMVADPECAHVLGDADPTAIVTDAKGAERLETIDADDPEVFVLGEDGPGLDAIGADPDAVTVPEVAATDDAAQYYTGGTTGDPKGVVYTHEVLVENLLAHLAEFDVGETDLGLLVTPLSHSAGTFLWMGLLSGGTVVVQDGFDVDRFADRVAADGVTWTMLVPTMLYRLLDADGVVADLRSLRRLFYGTAPVRPARIAEAVERFDAGFVQFYGQTEVPNLVTTLGVRAHERAVADDDLTALRSAGTPAHRVALRTVDPETGDQTDPGTPGEVVVAAPYVFDRYHERPDRTAETLRDGWVHTGDVGRIEPDGSLTLLDRKGNVVVTGGLNVYTTEVERVLSEHPGVADAIVIGVPDPEWGEAVYAVVERSDGPTAEELREYVGQHLASYKKPKTIEVRESLPRTSLGKLDRQSVREEFWADEDRSVH
ncbi:MAG: class I adenylate-forming enzyme family protein [Halanaeroarchaeum sp.]